MSEPAPRYDATTALVVADVQNDFAHPRGSLYVREGEQVIPVINREIQQADTAGAVVVYTQDWHPPDTPHFEKDGGIWPVHCVGGTWGAEFAPELEVVGPSFRKGTGGEDGYSGFTMRHPETGEEASTGLEEMLRKSGVDDVVVVGLALDYCVKETALDAARLGFTVTLLTEATRAVNLQPDDGDRALQEIAAAGVTIV
jgi:nicotinamidase/pyrazinamidase